MDTTRALFLLSLLLFSVCGVGATVGKSEVDEDFKEGYSRTDAEQEPFSPVILEASVGEPQSTLFASCLATSRTLDAKFYSIETESGSEYIRYVPEQSTPVPWQSVEGAVSNIFECTEAADNGGWPMFKYDGSDCKVVNKFYSLTHVPECNDEETEAVFVSTAAPGCFIPSFYLGTSAEGVDACLLINTTPMTYGEAKNFCESYEEGSNALSLYKDSFRPNITIEMVINKLQEYNYSGTDFWVGAEVDAVDISGNFSDVYWVGGQKPNYTTFQAAYLDSQANWKLRPTQMSHKAGAICRTDALESSSKESRDSKDSKDSKDSWIQRIQRFI